MTLVRWNPWSELSALHGQMDELFNDAFGDGARDSRGYATLPVDIRQTDDAYLVEASVPGFRPEDVELTFADGILTVRGERTAEEERKDGSYVRRERRTTSVFRQVGLPAEVRAEAISATYEDGVLTVTIPRARKAEPKRIPVNAGKRGTAARVVDAVKGSPKS